MLDGGGVGVSSWGFATTRPTDRHHLATDRQALARRVLPCGVFTDSHRMLSIWVA